MGRGDVPSGEIAATGMGNLALADQRLHRVPDLLPGTRPVHMVHLVAIDVIGPEPFRPAAGAANVTGRQATIVPSCGFSGRNAKPSQVLEKIGAPHRVMMRTTSTQ